MANIDEELGLARQALAAIENRPKDTFAILRKAAFMARQTFSSEAKLNEARRKSPAKDCGAHAVPKCYIALQGRRFWQSA